MGESANKIIRSRVFVEKPIRGCTRSTTRHVGWPIQQIPAPGPSIRSRIVVELNWITAGMYSLYELVVHLRPIIMDEEFRHEPGMIIDRGHAHQLLLFF